MQKNEIAEALLQRFQGLETAYGLFHPQDRKKGVKKDGKGQTTRGTVTPMLWENHITGRAMLGIVPINEDAYCHWGAIDIDDYNVDLLELEKKIHQYVLPLTVIRSKSGGAHLQLYLKDEAPARKVRQTLGDWAVALGHPGVEIFPKQDELAGPEDVGNWLNMPYFGALGNEKIQSYAIYKGEPLDVIDFLELAEARAIPGAALEDIKPVGGPISDGPPCLQTMALHGIPEGGRNEALFALGVYAKLKYGDNWENELNDINQQYLDPPLPFQEVGDIAKSLRRKEYNYTCKKQPLAGYCNREICRSRPFGIGASSGPEDPGVMIDGLTQLQGEVPVWFVTVNGIRMQITTDELLNQGRFARKCVEKLRFFPNQMKPVRWQKLINSLLKNAEVVDMPTDSGAGGQFWLLLEQFCTGYQVGRQWEDMLRGMPYTDTEDPDGPLTFFRSTDLMKFLHQQQFRELRQNEMWAILRENGAKHRQKNIKGKCVQMWGIPAFDNQEEEFNVPEPDTGDFS